MRCIVGQFQCKQRQDAQLHMIYHWKTSSSVHMLSAFVVKDGTEVDDMVCTTVHETRFRCMR